MKKKRNTSNPCPYIILKKKSKWKIITPFLRPTYDFRQEILSHGAEIEALSPESFRNEIKKIVTQIQEIYK